MSKAREYSTGQMRSYVECMQALASTTEAGGGDVITHTSLGSCWACIESQNYKEVFAADATFSTSKARIVMRYRTDLSINDQIIDRSGATAVTYEIASINDPDGRRKYVEIFAVQVQT